MRGNLFHLGKELRLALIAADPDSVRSSASTDLHNHNLVASRRLNKALAADMHPFDVNDRKPALSPPAVKDQLVRSDDELAVP